MKRGDETAKADDAASACEILRAVAAERARVAARLHDSICQTLGAAQLHAGVIAHRLSAVAGDDLRELCEMLRRSVQELYDFAWELRPAEWADAGGIKESLALMARQVSRKVPCESECSAVCPVDWETAGQLLQLAHEAVSYAWRLPNVTGLRLNLTAEGRAVVLSLSVKGAVFPDPDSVERATGLESLWERARAAGGRVNIDPTVGESSVFRCVLATSVSLNEEKR